MKKRKKKNQTLFRSRGKNSMGLPYLIYQVGERLVTHYQGNTYCSDNYEAAHRFAKGEVPSYVRGHRIEEVK